MPSLTLVFRSRAWFLCLHQLGLYQAATAQRRLPTSAGIRLCSRWGAKDLTPCYLSAAASSLLCQHTAHQFPNGLPTAYAMFNYV
jgi:hypothetical protein